MALVDDLRQLIDSAAIDYITSPDDIVLYADKTAVYNFINEYRTLLSSLESIDTTTDLNFFAKDIYTIFMEMAAHINRRNPNIKDFSTFKLENLILEAVAFQRDKNYYHSDMMIKQSILELCDQHKFILLHAAMAGYLPQTGVSSRVKVVLTLDSPITENIYYNKDNSLKILSFDSKFTFEVEDEFLISAGSLSASFYVRNRERQTIQYTVTDTTVVGYALTGSPFLSENLEVSVDDTPWTLVDNFYFSLPTDTHYTYTFTENQEGTIHLNYVEIGNVIDIVYYLGGIDATTNTLSEANNIEPFYIDRIDILEDTSDNAVTSYTIYNEAKPTGGRNIETLADIKLGIKKKLAKNKRTITLSDFEEACIKGSTSAVRALALDSQRAKEHSLTLTNTDILASNLILYIVNENLEDLINNEETDIVNHIITNRGAWNGIISETGYSNVTFSPAIYKDIDIVGTVYFNTANFNSQLDTIKQAVIDFFNPASVDDTTGIYNMDWGLKKSKLGVSNIIREIENNFGAIGKRVVLTTPSTNYISINKLEFPRLNSLTLIGEIDI